MADSEDSAQKSKEGSFTVSLLSEQDRKDFEFVNRRIEELQKVRQDHYGHNLDNIWNDADRDYIPHRINNKTTKRVIATDEEKGWRGQMVTLGQSNWQSDISQANAFVKIQTALAILIDQNPSGVFTPANKRFQATNEVVKQLYQHSWEVAKSKEQLKLFVFNLAKYGWACARTYPLRLVRKTKVLTQYNQEEPDKSVYEEKEVVEYNDIMRESLDPRNVWLDDMARPNNPYSIKDFAWRKVYDYDEAEIEFGKYPFWKYVQPGGNTQEVINLSEKGQSQKIDHTRKVELYGYENKSKDLLVIKINGVPVVMTPLPISDSKGIKKLSLWQTYWNLRHSQSPYGIGIYEAMRFDQAMLDRIRNMTLDQLTLSIYKMFFYQGTNSLENTGDIKITPGVGKQVLDPKNISWLETPGPGKDAYMGVEMLRKDVDEASGITDPLLGAVTGKTAFEIAQAKESALKRLKNPLENILEALNTEGYLTVSLIQLIYSVPEVMKITDPRLIDDYLKEIKSDPDLFERNSTMVDGVQQEEFNAKVYREFPLNLEDDEEGNLIESADSQFLRIKPDLLPWEGVINIKAQSILTPSKQVDKALDLEMYNILLPVMQQIAQERLFMLQSNQPWSIDNATQGKAAKEIIKLYDKDPRDIFPDEWMQEVPAPLFIPAPQTDPATGQPIQALGGPNPAPPQAETAVPSVTPPTNPTSLPAKMSAKMSAPLRL